MLWGVLWYLWEVLWYLWEVPWCLREVLWYLGAFFVQPADDDAQLVEQAGACPLVATGVWYKGLSCGMWG